MARTRRRRRRTTTRKSPPWIWAITGLLAGLFVAFLVFLQMQPESEVTVEETLALDIPTETEARDVRKQKPAPVPPPPKPRFDFYNLLPEMEVIVQDEEIKGAPSKEGVKRVEQPGTYLLQAGSFRSHTQADQLRAKLALLGLETSIQSVSVNSKQAWHRVRVGPFLNLSDLNQARSLLKKNGIDAILIRIKS
ncbi:SPOR domain-containing protein [Pseudomonadota bacterium]